MSSRRSFSEYNMCFRSANKALVRLGQSTNKRAKTNSNNMQESYNCAREPHSTEVEAEDVREPNTTEVEAEEAGGYIEDSYLMDYFGESDDAFGPDVEDRDDEDVEDAKDDNGSDISDGGGSVRSDESGSDDNDNLVDINKQLTENEIRDLIRSSDKYDSFSITAEIDSLLLSWLIKMEGRNAEIDKPLIQLCDGSKGEVAALCKQLHSAFVLAGIDLKARNQILEAIDTGFHCTLPRYAYHDHQKGSMLETLLPVPPVLKFHVCPNGDHVYVGKTKFDPICPVPTCQRVRARKCQQPACKDIPVTDVCPHTFDYRSPFRWVQYRPICVYLQLALKHELFYKFSTCQYKKTPKGVAWDVMQKRVAQEQMEAMHRNWEAQSNEIKSTCKPLNLLFGINYDGVRIYQKKTSNFNPLLLFILNLPPYLRSKKGVGMFPVSIFDAIVGVDFTDSENFLLWKCLVEELLALEKGKIIETIDDNGKRHKFFVQGRVILHCYDTRALEKIMRIKSTNSFAWCFLCGSVQGSRFKELGNTCNIGNRGLLALDSILRYMGQSMSCCPRGFYGLHRSHDQYQDPKEVIDQNAAMASILYQQNQIALCVQPGMEDDIIENVIPCCSGLGHEKIVQRMLKDQFRFTWRHANIIPVTMVASILGKYLYYEHMDLRPVIPYARTTNSEYFNKGIGSLDQSRKKKDFCQDGIKGIYPFALVGHGDISRHLCWDPFHILVLLAEHLIGLWKNQRANNAKIRAYCASANIHPTVQFNADTDNNNEQQKSKKRGVATELQQPVWAIPSPLQTLIDNVIAVMMLPTNSKNDFQVKSIFHATGHLNGISKIKVVAVLVDLVNFCVHHFMPTFSDAYLYLFKIISYDVSMMMARGFSDQAADKLFQNVIEMVCLYEGMFPPSESLASIHHLIDIAAHLKTFGPITSWWALSGERAVGDSAEKNPCGGSSTYVTAFQREYQECDVVMENEWNISHNDFHNSLQAACETIDLKKSFILTGACANLEEADGSIYAVPPKTYPLNNRNNKVVVRLNVKENKLLLHALVQHIKSATECHLPDTPVGLMRLNHICRHSIFTRLYMFLQAMKLGNHTFMQRLHNHFIMCVSSQEREHMDKNDNDFILWIKYAYVCLSSAFKSMVVKPLDIIIDKMPKDEDHSYLTLMSGSLFKSDYVFLKKHKDIFITLNIHLFCSFYNKIAHRGITLRGRYQPSNQDVHSNGRLSDVERALHRNKWYLNSEINSWCFLGDNVDSGLQAVGQISYFVTLSNCEEESEFNDKIWAHFLGQTIHEEMCKPVYSRLRFVSAVATSTSHGQFVSIDDIVASSIAVLPLSTINSTPHKIYATSLLGLKSVTTQRSHLHRYFTQSKELVNTLCLFPLQPYNEYIVDL